MTHPFHRLHGREFELVETMAVVGVEWVHYTGDDGALRTIRQAWTSVDGEDPFVRVAAGRSAFRVSDLLALAALLDGLDEDGRGGKGAVGETNTVKGVLPHV